MVPLFRYTGPSLRTCGLCRAQMVRLLGIVGQWYACVRCDAP